MVFFRDSPKQIKHNSTKKLVFDFKTFLRKKIPKTVHQKEQKKSEDELNPEQICKI